MNSHEARSDVRTNLAGPHVMRRAWLVLAALSGLTACSDWQTEPDPPVWEHMSQFEESRIIQLIPLPGNRLLLAQVEMTPENRWGMSFADSEVEYTVWDQGNGYEYQPAAAALAYTDEEGRPYFVERHDGGKLAIRGYKGRDVYGPVVRGLDLPGYTPLRFLYVDSTGGLITDFGTPEDPRPSYLPAHLADCTTSAGERCEYAPDGGEWQPLDLPGDGFGIYPSSMSQHTVAYTKDGGTYLVISSPDGRNELVRIEPGGTAVSVPVPCGTPASLSCRTAPTIISGGPARDHVDFYVSYFAQNRLYRLEGESLTLLVEGRGEEANWHDVFRGGNGNLYFDIREGPWDSDRGAYVLDGRDLRRIVDLPSMSNIGVTDDGNLYVVAVSGLDGDQMYRLIR